MRRIESGAAQAAAGAWVAFLIRHCLAGMMAGWTTVGGLLWLDVAGLGSLVISSDLFPLPLLMLLASFGLTFGSVAVGSAVMGLGRSGETAAPGPWPATAQRATRSVPKDPRTVPARPGGAPESRRRVGG